MPTIFSPIMKAVIKEMVPGFPHLIVGDIVEVVQIVHSEREVHIDSPKYTDGMIVCSTDVIDVILN